MGKREVRVDHDTAPRFTLPMTLCLLIRTRQNIIPRVMTITMAAKITLMGTTTAITVVVELLSPVEMYRPLKHTKYLRYYLLTRINSTLN